MSYTLPNDNVEQQTLSSDNDNPIDPVTGLSRREKDYVQHSWNRVRQDLKAAGLGFFHAFFTAHPEYQKKFKAFNDTPLEELADNRGFQVHAMSVMNAVTMVVDSLDDSSRLVQELKNLGESHGKHDIRESHFRNLAAVLVAFLESALGPQHFHEQVKRSWIKALNVVVDVVATGLPQRSPQHPAAESIV